MLLQVSLWFRCGIDRGIVTERYGSFHQEDDGSGINADGENDFEHGFLALVWAEMNLPDLPDCTG